MKKLIYTVAFFAITISLTSCSKDEVEATTTAATNGTFTWSADNGATTVTADSAYYDSRYKTIKAFKGGMAKFVEINLTADTVGNYTIGSANAISFLNGSDLYIANTGLLSISAKSATKLSGVFSSASTSSSITSFNGTFTNINVR